MRKRKECLVSTEICDEWRIENNKIINKKDTYFNAPHLISGAFVGGQQQQLAVVRLLVDDAALHALPLVQLGHALLQLAQLLGQLEGASISQGERRGGAAQSRGVARYGLAAHRARRLGRINHRITIWLMV